MKQAPWLRAYPELILDVHSGSIKILIKGKPMDKNQMVREIVTAAKNASILQNRYLDVDDLILKLAFRTEDQLQKICAGLNIK